jgi:hypothetical protein
MRAGRLRRRVVLGVLAALAAPPAGYVAWDWGQDNFGVVEPGRVFRAAQMDAAALTRTIRDHRIKTVLNLRGANPGSAWYRAERAATTAAGASQVDVALSSCEWMSRDQLRALVRVLDTSEYPLLMHCQHGSERTGWVAAVATLLRPGGSLDDADRQFSILYLYTRLRDGKIMAEHLDQYKGWLRARGWAHAPGRFRLWVDSGFRPGTPSREEWPYDPYPLVVITRPPGAAGPVAGSGAGVRR